MKDYVYDFEVAKTFLRVKNKAKYWNIWQMNIYNYYTTEGTTIWIKRQCGL